jgi:dTDP-4-dehydrorhamnose 3,5-epimerase
MAFGLRLADPPAAQRGEDDLPEGGRVPGKAVDRARRDRHPVTSSTAWRLSFSTVRVQPTGLDGPLLLAPEVHGDSRGFFVETFRSDDLPALGLGDGACFVQDNHSRSRRGVIRGMHFTIGGGIAKLVRCASGSIVDVIVDIRRGSPQFGQWEAFTLDDRDHAQLLVPVGFAHGFCVTSEIADVCYKQTGYYEPGTDRGIAYDDPEVGIEWPMPLPDRIVSARDATAPRLAQAAAELPFVYRG